SCALAFVLFSTWGTGARAEPVQLGDHDYYFGDLHVHTGLSQDGGSNDLDCPWGEACGDYSTVLVDARDLYDLDFLALTDHGNGHHQVLDPEDWETQLADVLAADDPEGGFVTVPGVEVWLWHADGEIRDHRNLYLFGDADDLDGLSLAELIPDEEAAPFTTDDCPSVFDWMEEVEATRGPALLIPHHPALQPPGATDWQCSDLRFNPVVENYSEHGNSQSASFEGSFDSGEDAEQADSLVDHALALDGYGLRLGLISGTDSHDTRPGSVCSTDPRFASKPNFGGGLAVVALPAGEPLDRAAIYGALRDRRTMATSGPRIPLDVQLWIDDTPVAWMGEEAEASAGAVLEVVAEVDPADAPYVVGASLVQPEVSTAPMTEVDTGRFREPLALAAGEVAVVYVLVELDGAAYWADAEVDCDDGGDDTREFLWSSPIWIEVDPLPGDDDDTSDDDDCACRHDPTPSLAAAG
ncbi:MAG: hypothetical protein QGH45_10005, partial [Myxococcota bacterium]|nr:hypothetical protein [Myxococcota bacterium]